MILTKPFVNYDNVWNDPYVPYDCVDLIDYWNEMDSGTMCEKIRFMDYFLKCLNHRNVKYKDKLSIIVQARGVRNTMIKLDLLRTPKEHDKSCPRKMDYQTSSDH